MFLVYSVEPETLIVKLYSELQNSLELAQVELHNTAVNFIKVESGDKKAQDPFRDGTPDSKITEDGYFLRHEVNKENKIEVYQRKTTITQGSIWGVTVSTKVKKVLIFGITECESNPQTQSPLFKPVGPVRPQPVPNTKQANNYNNLLTELKDTLLQRRLSIQDSIEFNQMKLNVNSERKITTIQESNEFNNQEKIMKLIQEARELYKRPLSPVDGNFDTSEASESEASESEASESEASESEASESSENEQNSDSDDSLPPLISDEEMLQTSLNTPSPNYKIPFFANYNKLTKSNLKKASISLRSKSPDSEYEYEYEYEYISSDSEMGNNAMKSMTSETSGSESSEESETNEVSGGSDSESEKIKKE